MRRLLVLVCFAAVLVAASAPAAGPRTYFARPLDDRLVFKPKTIEFKDLDLTKITWTGWGGKTATGRATASTLSCDPSCATGERIKTTARLRMFKRRTKGNKRVYGCMTGTLADGDVRRVVWPPGCSR